MYLSAGVYLVSSGYVLIVIAIWWSVSYAPDGKIGLNFTSGAPEGLVSYNVKLGYTGQSSLRVLSPE